MEIPTDDELLMNAEFCDVPRETRIEKYNQIKEELDLSQLSALEICRFLCARDFDVEKASVMLKDHLEWRKENNFDYPPDYHYAKSEILYKSGCFVIGGFSKNGSLIIKVTSLFSNIVR